ncbi:Diadenylate cyclase spyDAC [Minicystis rosea]|nr:Diadenylate cyclase spyDAC [Minicystis rosea]
MRELLIRLFSGRTAGQALRDVVDVIIVAWVVYRALLVLRGTRAIQMAFGLGIVALVYLAAKALKLATLTSLLSSLLSSIVLIVVVVFQNDIRRALIRMGNTAWFTGGREQQSRVIDEVVAAATELARHRMGALIAFEQDANVLEFTKSEGIQLDCVVTRELLVSLFVPESVNKLHDGAVLIRDLRIARAGVFFPMPDTKILDAQLGSRHRAALGITEETDAVVVVVSEERGTISFCFSGNIVSNLDGQSLRHALLGLFGRAQRKKRPGTKKAPASTPAPAPPIRPPAALTTTRPSSGVASPAGPLSTTKPQAGAPTPKLIAPSTPMRSAGDGPRPEGASPASTATPGPPSIAPRPSTFVPSATPKRAPEEGDAPTDDDA